MGLCFSTTKVSGSSSNNAGGSNRSRKCSAATPPVTAAPKHPPSEQGQRRREATPPPKNQRAKEKASATRRPGAHVPCGKRTDFGYEKDFDKRFSLGKLLGHGQFGYTYVGVDRANGDRVAVKRLEKSKVQIPSLDFVIVMCL